MYWKTGLSEMQCSGLKLAVLVTGVLTLFPPSANAEWEVFTPVESVSIINPEPNEVWLMDSPHTLSCTQSTDTDRWRSSEYDDWIEYGDDVAHWWTAGGGSFPNNNNIGTSVSYVAPGPGSDTVTCYGDDDYVPAGVAYNDVDANDGRVSASRGISIEDLEVHKVGFTGDNALFETPTTGSEWDDGTVAVQNHRWVMDDPAGNARQNFVCYSRFDTPTTICECRTSQPLTEGSSFKISATTPSTSGTKYFDWGTGSIGAGSRESSLITCPGLFNCGSSVYNGNWSISWEFKCAPKNIIRQLNSTSHKLFITWDNPAGDSVTVRRVDQVTDSANGESVFTVATDAVYDDLSGTYDLNGPVVPLEVWRIHEGDASQCPGLAIFVCRHFAMLGLGSGTLNYCHATATNGTYAGGTTFNEPTRSGAAGSNGHPTGVNHGTEYLTHYDGNGGANRFEATCFFDGWHWALGLSKCKKATAEEVVLWAFGNPPDIKWTHGGVACPYNPWTP